MVITLFVFEIISQKSKGSRIERKKARCSSNQPIEDLNLG